MTTQTKYRKYDSESDYYAMGYRVYSAEFGRFLAVDPLFEAMPRHNPYHYSYNSPMFWSDPSGLVPVKEKVKNSERLLMLQLDTRIFEEAYDGIMEENGRAYARMSRTYSYDLNNLRTNGKYFTWNIWNAFNVFDLYMGSGGGSGGSVAENSEESRSGVSGSGTSGGFFGWLWDGVMSAVDALTGVFSSNDLTDEEINAKDYGVIAEVEVFGEKEQILPEATWWDFILNGGWNRTADIGGNEYIIDANGYSTGMLAPLQGTPPDVSIGVVGKVRSVIEILELTKASQLQMLERGFSIAGAGSKRNKQIRDLPRLINTYGGNPSEWSKKVSTSFQNNLHQIETHWYENIVTGKKYEFKSKIIR